MKKIKNVHYKPEGVFYMCNMQTCVLYTYEALLNFTIRQFSCEQWHRPIFGKVGKLS